MIYADAIFIVTDLDPIKDPSHETQLHVYSSKRVPVVDSDRSHCAGIWIYCLRQKKSLHY
jgi:hypothetical protein